jgi:hypothetical protein
MSFNYDTRLICSLDAFRILETFFCVRYKSHPQVEIKLTATPIKTKLLAYNPKKIRIDCEENW